jgi:hypothetical protein
LEKGVYSGVENSLKTDVVTIPYNKGLAILTNKKELVGTLSGMSS